MSPPADGWYLPGDEIGLRAVFTGRLVAAPDPSKGMRRNALRLRVGPNTGNTFELRNTYLSAVDNAGEHGYVEYRYTVTAADADTDGVQLWSTQKAGEGRGYVCPGSV